MFGKGIESQYLFTPSEGGSQSCAHGRVVLHPSCESDCCVRRLFQWEYEHAEEACVLAVVVHHLERLWLAWRHGIHQPI